MAQSFVLPDRFPNSLTRRQIVKSIGLCGLGSSVAAQRLYAATTPASAKSTSSGLSSDSAALPVSTVSGRVVKNRAPFAQNAFYLLPLGAVRPRGWYREQLRIQADGLSGHLDETWADVGPNSGWLGGKGESWERGPYFLDGLLPLAYLLEDERLKAKAQKYIDWTLDHQHSDGMFGPTGNDDWWPRIVMLKVLTQYQEFTNDPRVIPMMEKYFAYQLQELPSRPLRDWGKFRSQDAVLSVVWLYNRTGSPQLVQLAKLLHQQGHDWVAQFADFKYKDRITSGYLKLDQDQGLSDLALSTHGVNNGQAIKAGPVWSQISGEKSDRHAVLQMIGELDKYHGLPNGMFSCDEHLAGPNPSQGSELCTVVEYMFSLEHSLAITGEVALGDRLELLAYNALPGTLTDDMWAHQYNQEPNQVECSLHREPWTTDGPESNIYGLEPNFGCCAANYHQGWPKLASSLFMISGEHGRESKNGVVASVYAPCEIETTLSGTPLRIIEETDYPFKGAVKLTISPASPLAFRLQLRIPGWANGTRITVNGERQAIPEKGTFAAIDRTWKPGDVVDIDFPMAPRVANGFHNSISIARGPIVFSHGIQESWQKLRDRGMTADWQVYPASPWNYALAVNSTFPEQSISVKEGVVSTGPFTAKHAPVRLSVKAKRVPEWRAVDGVAEPLPESPVASTEAEETIELIPYAAAKLRITSFPRLKG